MPYRSYQYPWQAVETFVFWLNMPLQTLNPAHLFTRYEVILLFKSNPKAWIEIFCCFSISLLLHIRKSSKFLLITRIKWELLLVPILWAPLLLFQVIYQILIFILVHPEFSLHSLNMDTSNRGSQSAACICFCPSFWTLAANLPNQPVVFA